MPTEYEVALANVRKYTNELANWLNQLGVSLRGMDDPQAARAVQMAGGCSNVAQKLGNSIIEISNSITNFPASSLHMGFAEPFNFVGGTKGETKTITVTGQTWVRAGVSRVVVINNTPPATSAVEYYSPSVSNYVNGAGFDVSLTTTDAATPLGQVGSAFWIGLPDG